MNDQEKPESEGDGTVDLETGAPKSKPEDVQVPAGLKLPDVTTELYDPRRVTDQARKYIGYALLALLVLIVIVAFNQLYWINMQANEADAKADGERLVSLLNIVFGPVVTLLGSVTGFYFGTQSAQATRDAAAGGSKPPASG